VDLTWLGLLVAPTLGLLGAVSHVAAPAVTELFVPVGAMTIHGGASPSEAEVLAVQHFQDEMARFTGRAMPVAWGAQTGSLPALYVGFPRTLPRGVSLRLGTLSPVAPDLTDQSYAIAALAPSDGHRSVVALGRGKGAGARSTLGLSYALGDLVRRLDVRAGRWGFVLPPAPLACSPAVRDRRFYIMNTSYIDPGLALERFDFEAIDRFVDRLVDARYSQVTAFQWSHLYLYPGSADGRRGENELIHRSMRRFFERARRRGLEVYQMVAPAHIELSLLAKGSRGAAKGYYAPTSICWSDTDARILASRVTQHEMEYYGPVDGYTVWFYDPPGCFCPECRVHQADRIVDQLAMVATAAGDISPGAKLEAVLWPTWCFHETPGIDLSKDEVKGLVGRFLDMCDARFGSRRVAVMDTCEFDFSNLFNGLVPPGRFARNGLLHSVLGGTIEQRYPFAPFRLRHLAAGARRICSHGLEAGTLTTGYAATTFASVYAFADMLYEGTPSAGDAMRRFAASVAKGKAIGTLVALLEAGEDLGEATSYAAMEAAMGRMEAAWRALEPMRLFRGDRDWLSGYVRAQRWYLRLAQTKDADSFGGLLDEFRKDVGAIPMYRAYMAAYDRAAPLGAPHHVRIYWRLRAGDDRPAN